MKLHSIIGLVLSCYVVLQVIIMPFVMDYESKANIAQLKERAVSLRSVNAWFPVSYFDGIEKLLPGNVMWLWHYLGFLKEDFFGLLKAHGMWGDATNAKWSHIFARWGFTDVHPSPRFRVGLGLKVLG